MTTLVNIIIVLLVVWSFFSYLIVVHEYSHLAAFKLCKIKVDQVNIGNVPMFKVKIGGLVHQFGLFPMLGLTISKDYARASKKQRAFIAAFGPIGSILFGLFLWVVDQYSPGWATRIGARASIALGVWNLMPFPPMDGWVILEYWLEKRGIKVTDQMRQALFGVGMGSIALFVWFAWQPSK
jgi:membrane-associated protease RseP (regulator of RpoE activity)